ncbi:2-C-methyl-D-erythritol 4-phosphate cytidylyltransferase [Nodularia harveyana UHCC-0300]|uniref:2-C-methyl-D-erythritol 4-phosphate cytidylyltransferase n=1 Tax=Nodularia harveyana UHCC-0300 TaxID=2974287 RepID=A0ABU5UJZ1_9CYAN|nr:2-C-methyl-D-erythritol 4-phosphate cytidylyltransferase [Nodularia harveyana]MEA5583678.1 2-C-methyl-D-erythritol 4-phosphate cytidylyltransferase [Nodularia harveyana UHCC-0300]
MYLLIPSAGVGKRMGGTRNKLLLEVRSQPIIAWTLKAAAAASEIQWIGIISQPVDWEDLQAIVTNLNVAKPVKFIAGGSTRQESVYKGLQALPDGAEHVLIHDGARCLATPDLLDSCAQAIRECSGLIAAVPVKDTIKVVDHDGVIQSTPDRQQLWAAQTPQGFNVELLKKCHAEGVRQGWEVTDDAALFERCGIEVRVVSGEETNLKVTTPQDLAIAEFILAGRGE